MKFNVKPRYTSGSPALVTRETAIRIEQQERLAYHYALKGRYGPAMQRMAKAQGLKLIIFTMKKQGRNWKVIDQLTGNTHVWPTLATCPTCGTKVECRRGVLLPHYYTKHFWRTKRFSWRTFDCHDRRYMGAAA